MAKAEGGKDEKGDARESERAENKVNGSYPRKTTRQQRATMLVPCRLEMNPIFRACDLEMRFT